jgi:VIT1/CCC1 family predicted Fe2+/Mn2+ transporter
MKESITTGFSFGITSGVITTLGLLVGLNSGTHSTVVVAGGVLTIAIADSLSDAVGIHIAEEAENVHTPAQIWVATIVTFLSKFVVAMSFFAIVALMELQTAVQVSILWGLTVLTLFSIKLAKTQGIPAWKVVAEHLSIAIGVVVITHFVGCWIATAFH